MPRAKRVTPEPGYRLRVEFENGVSGMIDLSADLFGTMFEPLRDVSFFEQAFIDEYGVVTWANGADLAPEVIYDEVLAAQKQAARP